MVHADISISSKIMLCSGVGPADFRLLVSVWLGLLENVIAQPAFLYSLNGVLIAVEQALSHPYLATLHDINDEPICSHPFEFDFEQPSFSEEHIKELILMEAVAFNPLPGMMQ